MQPVAWTLVPLTLLYPSRGSPSLDHLVPALAQLVVRRPC